MNSAPSTMQRPQRWDEPFDPGMSDHVVAHLLQSVEPFRSMDPTAFSRSVSLHGILSNDCRLHSLQKGDIIVREGDYGGSAFLILTGEALVSLKSLPPDILGRRESKPKGWLRSLAQLWGNDRHAEVRDYSEGSHAAIGSREDEQGTRVFLHDVPRVIPIDKAVVLNEGEVFGEISALTRSTRSATVVANSSMELLEIRWQGFRELMRRHSAMKEHVERLYRANSLRVHLRETPMLSHLNLEQIDKLASAVEFESFGEFQWNANYKSMAAKDISERILSEPIIAEQGQYVNGLIMIRNGFARLSRKHGDGQQTFAYLGKGKTFGLRELAHNFSSGEQRPYMLSLRAVGHVDILRIPVQVVEETILPAIPKKSLPPRLPSLVPSERADSQSRRMSKRAATMDPGLMEFLVERRLINGTKTMVIDLDRCTRCDDCVRACAATHNNNPRFVRQGIQHDHWMIANACMHCMDPVCMIGCPTGAIGRDSKTGSVTINDQSCIGCSTCANSCPYSNIRMVEINNRSGKKIVDQESGDAIVKATKCDFCADQLGGPNCQRACPHDALVRIDLTTPDNLTDWTRR